MERGINLIKKFKKGEKVRFLGTEYIMYDTDGNELYVELVPGEIYTIKEALMVCIKLEEFDGIYLKEFFREVTMKYYRITYQPAGSHDKQWTVLSAKDEDELRRSFSMGTIIKIEETTEEDYEDYKPDYLR